MRLDVSRDNFNQDDRLLRVPQEQGGLLIDADANAQTAVLLYRMHTAIQDVFGESWGPAAGAGFAIDPTGGKYTIGDGRYYAGGQLCEMPKGRTLFDQSDVPAEAAVELPPTGQFLLYLDVWERLLPTTDPADGRDYALDGTRPTPRTRLVSQVRVFPDKESTYDKDANLVSVVDAGGRMPPLVPVPKPVNLAAPTPAELAATAAAEATNKAAPAIARATAFPQIASGKLRARPIARPDDAPDPVELENQLYRVEIHRGGEAVAANAIPDLSKCATFKWSRENGAVSFPIDEVVEWDGKTARVTLATGFTDDRFALVVGDWVEYADDVTELRPRAVDPAGWAPSLFRVTEVGTDLPVVVALALEDGATVGEYEPRVGDDTPPNPVLIRWDHGDVERQKAGESVSSLRRATDDALVVVLPANPASLKDDDWLPLEAGVSVQFVPDNGAKTFRRGDYWLIPARSASGAVDWPADATNSKLPAALPPHETRHVYVPLAATAKAGDPVNDLRRVLDQAKIDDLFKK